MSEATPEYSTSGESVESGSGTPEPAADRAAGEPAVDDREAATLPGTGTPGAGDPQAPSAARVTREAVAGGSGISSRGPEIGAGDPPPPVEGAGQPDVGVSDTTAAVPVDPGRKSGGVTTSEVVGAVRPHAPDGEVGPA